MNLNEFETQSRDVVEQALTQLQTVTLLVADLETRIVAAGLSVQGLGQLVEQFAAEQRNQPPVEE